MASAVPCPQCGISLPATARLCPSCGTRLVSAPQPVASLPPILTPIRAPTPLLSPLTTISSHVDAGFWRRVAAFLLDLLAFAIPAYIAAQALPIFGNLIAWWLYFALCESSSWQATPGKLLMKLRVTDVNGVRIKFWRATGRFFGRFASMLPLGAGFVMAAFTQNKQALHDFIASTRVLRK